MKFNLKVSRSIDIKPQYISKLPYFNIRVSLLVTIFSVLEPHFDFCVKFFKLDLHVLLLYRFRTALCCALNYTLQRHEIVFFIHGYENSQCNVLRHSVVRSGLETYEEEHTVCIFGVANRENMLLRNVYDNLISYKQSYLRKKYMMTSKQWRIQKYVTINTAHRQLWHYIIVSFKL